MIHGTREKALYGEPQKEPNVIRCQLEEHVPIPTGVPSPGEIPGIQARAAAACRAAEVLCREGYTAPPPPEEQVRQGIRDVLETVAKGDPTPPKTFSDLLATPVGAIRVNAVLTQYDMEVVKDSKRLRTFITNKLVLETNNHDAKVRLKALELLGKITDVALFTERSEVTLSNRSTAELETILKEKLRRFLPQGAPQEIEDATIIHQEVDEGGSYTRNAGGARQLNEEGSYIVKSAGVKLDESVFGVLA